MHPELTCQLGDRPVPSDRRQRHLRLEPRIMFLPCPLHVLLPRYPRVLGAGLHLSQLSHFRGPPHWRRTVDAKGRIISHLILTAIRMLVSNAPNGLSTFCSGPPTSSINKTSQLMRSLPRALA